MRVRLNIRACLVTAVVAAVLAGGAFAGQRWQVRRHAAGLLELAEAAEARGRADRAVGLYMSYLAMVPSDTDARARYGLLLDRSVRGAADLGVAAGVFEQVLAEDPGRADIRERLARLYARAGRPQQALPLLIELKADAGPDAGLAFLLGECKEATGDLPGAESQYKRSLALDPKPIDRSLRLAVLDRRIGGAADRRADEAIDRAVAVNPDNGLAYLARARYRLSYKTGDATPDLAAAVRLAPNNVEVRLVAAAAAADPVAARDHLQAALAASPRDERVYAALASAEGRGPGGPAAGIAVLRRGLAALPGSDRLLLAMTEAQLAAGDGPEAERYAAELGRWKRSPEQVVLLRGRAKMVEGDWRAARETLEAGRPTLTTAAGDLAAVADLLIGRCHEQAGEDDLALAAFRRAAAAAPRRADVQEGMARVLVRAGRLGEAVQQYARLVADPAAAPDVWLVYARLKAVEYLSQPPADRRAGDLDEVFKDADKRRPGSVELLTLRAEVQAADGRPDEARRALKEAYAGRPADVGIGLALARLATRLGDRAEAARVLAGMSGAADPDWHSARLDVLPADGPQAEAVLKAAEAAAGGGGPPEARLRLAAALAETYTRRKAWPDARRWWREVARLRPADIGVWFRMFELGVQADDRGQMEEAVREVERVEGSDGAYGHFAEALLRFVRPQDRSPEAYREARDHLTAAALKRPTWANVPAARAWVAELEGRTDEALAEYTRAVELGDRRPQIVRRAVQLLCAKRRYPAAERLIQQAQAQSQNRDQFDRLAAEVSLRTLDVRRAVELAGSAVAPMSQDYTDHLWKGEILAAAGRRDDATAAFRRAVEVAGAVGAPRVALVGHLTRTGRAEEAAKEIAALPTGLTGPELDLTTAQCLVAANRPKEAADAFRKAVGSRPGDVEVVRQAADFFEQSGDPSAAVPALRHLLGASPAAVDLAWTRRALARVLAADPRPAAFREAVGLLDQNLAAGADPAADRIAKARVLATRLPYRREALGLMHAARRQRPLGADDEFFLGQLSADTGAWADGRRMLIDVISQGGARPSQLAFLVDRLVRHDDLSDAEFWLDRLEQAAPDSPSAVRVRAVVLSRRGRGAEAADRLRKLAPADVSKPADRDRVRGFAELADEVAREVGPAAGRPLTALAGELFARAAAGGRSIDLLAQAGYLGRRGKVESALELCRQARAGGDPLAAVVTLVGILYVNPPLAEAELGAVEREFTACLDRVRPSADKESLLAVARARRGRYAEAAEAFGRQAAAGGGPEALNNQAYMLVLAGDPSTASGLVERAVAEVGPTAGLLDTRGAARLAVGRVADAVADAEGAVDQEPTAVRCLHLAEAYQRAGRPKDAATAMSQASKLRETAAAFLPAEQAVFDRLAAETKSIK